MSYVVWNPFLYAFFNPKFQEALREFIREEVKWIKHFVNKRLFKNQCSQLLNPENYKLDFDNKSWQHWLPISFLYRFYVKGLQTNVVPTMEVIEEVTIIIIIEELVLCLTNCIPCLSWHQPQFPMMPPNHWLYLQWLLRLEMNWVNEGQKHQKKAKLSLLGMTSSLREHADIRLLS